MADEMRYLMENVLTLVPYADAVADSKGKIINGRWRIPTHEVWTDQNVVGAT